MDYRKCGQEDCDLPATYFSVWAENNYACIIHMQVLLNVAAAIGFTTPSRTMRLLTPDEMVIESDGSED